MNYKEDNWLIKGIEQVLEEDFDLEFKEVTNGKKCFLGKFKDKNVNVYLPIFADGITLYYLDEKAKEGEIFYISQNDSEEYLENLNESIIQAEDLAELIESVYWDTPVKCEKKDYQKECEEEEFGDITGWLYGDSFSNTREFLITNEYL